MPRTATVDSIRVHCIYAIRPSIVMTIMTMFPQAAAVSGGLRPQKSQQQRAQYAKKGKGQEAKGQKGWKDSQLKGSQPKSHTPTPAANGARAGTTAHGTARPLAASLSRRRYRQPALTLHSTARRQGRGIE